jgi:hypothetical protein
MIPELAKAWVLSEIESSLEEREPDEVRRWAEKWLKGEVSLAVDVLRPRAEQLRQYKFLALEVLKRLDVASFRKACQNGRPELKDVWDSAEAEKRIKEELEAIHVLIMGLKDPEPPAGSA